MNNTPNVMDKQQADKNAVSGTEWTKKTFWDCVLRNAKIVVKEGSTIRERFNLNRNKLISKVCQDYRAHFAGLYGKTDKLPSEVFGQIEESVDLFIADKLSQVNKLNVLNIRRNFYHSSNDMEITERVVATGENKLSLQEQKFGVIIMLGNARKKLEELQKKPTPDYEREKLVKEQIMRLEITEKFILGEIKHQENLTQPQA